jgi:hypothetical protein
VGQPLTTYGRVPSAGFVSMQAVGDLEINTSCGRDYPQSLKKHKLILHYGACMMSRREMLNHLRKVQGTGTPVTNYDIAISFLQGVTKRNLALFPFGLIVFKNDIQQNCIALLTNIISFIILSCLIFFLDIRLFSR